MKNIINMILTHSSFGNGQLKEFLGDSVTVRFSHGDENLPFPQSFENVLKAVNEDDAKKIEEIIARWNSLKKEEERRNKFIMQSPRVPLVREYDEKRRQQKETWKTEDEEKQAKKQAFREERDKAIEEAKKKKAKKKAK